MYFLSSCVRGRALECIATLPITAESFPLAWKTLTQRFENKRRLIGLHLSALLDLPCASRETAAALQALSDRVDHAVASLRNLGRTTGNLWNDMLVHLVVQKLDANTRKAWKMRAGDGDVLPSYDELKQFLFSCTRALEELDQSTPVRASSRGVPASRVHVATASAGAPVACPLCRGRHFLYSCPRFRSQSPTERRDVVQKFKLCFNCLSSRHSRQQCPSKFRCRICHKEHHTMLHTASDSVSERERETLPSGRAAASPARDAVADVQSLIASAALRPPTRVLLATAWIAVGDGCGRTARVRALLDQGSEMTFISEHLAQSLRVRRIRMPVSISAVGGIRAGTVRHAASIAISPTSSPSPALETTALILGSVTSYAPKATVRVQSLEYLSDLQLADPDPSSSAPIEIIIGADLYNAVLLDGVRKGARDQPVAQKTVFGWVLSGPIGARDSDVLASVAHSAVSPSSISVHHCLDAESVDALMQRFWAVEEVPNQPVRTSQEELCDAHFRATHSRAPNGRYVVRLPFKSGPPINIGESRSRAERMLQSLQRKLKRDAQQESEYIEFLSEYERLGHMQPVPSSQFLDAQCVYIPHHAVFREGSATSHLRVVFNASCLTSNGSSLNDHLYAGPKLQSDITNILLQWRRHRFVYTADIAKMYRQILVDSRDVDYQRIIWTISGGVPTDYRLLTVTYGTACAPYLALRVLHQLADDEGHAFPLAVPLILNNLYVDDVLFGDDNPESLRRTRNQLVALLRRGGFELRKWASNHSPLLSDLDPSNHGLASTKIFAPDERLKILGIGWNPVSDSIDFSVSLSEQPPSTKRSILSAVARIYDPLGWITPVTISAKIFMQQLWRCKLDWDEQLGADLQQRWLTIYSGLHHVRGLRVVRWLGLGSECACAELHEFSDASNQAYAAAVYLRVISLSGQVTTTLIAGKSRVAPLSPISVPRLELCGALLLARLMSFIQVSPGFESLPGVCWTDSTIVLAWVTSHPSRWKTFVANRVTAIQSAVPACAWRHVPTEHNPADCASRGLLGHEIHSLDLWWRGPSWLRQPSDDWPHPPASLAINDLAEARVVALQCLQAPPAWELSSRYSSWPKLLRVTAYIMRFVHRCRRTLAPREERPCQALSVSELTSAKSFWIRRIQVENFSAEIAALSQHTTVSSRSSIAALSPFLDKEGILRVGGRLNKAPYPFTFRHPVLLSSHPLVKLIVQQAHVRALHAGIQLTSNILRRDFWILRGRSVVRSVIHRCVVCARERAVIPTQFMGDLPEPRVSPSIRRFVHCGIDYAGPFQIRVSAGRGVKSRKAYLALFVCLTTRAIHLELVSDYTTEAFVKTFSRFCARRGLPTHMYSDNGTPFVGADRDLASAYRSALQDSNFLNATATDGMEWHFIPPSAPHFGGLWEAGVRSAKHHLRRVLGNSTLTYEEFSTLLCGVEACLNSRPIAPLSDSLNDYEYLTPGHFLIGSAITVPPEPSTLDLNENRLSRWQRVRHMTERFWALWQSDYVNTLQQRSKWRDVQPQIKIGQLAFLRNPSLPPCKWELGRVTQCHPSVDGHVRVVNIKTATSEFRRPIGKLCVLPIPP